MKKQTAVWKLKNKIQSTIAEMDDHKQHFGELNLYQSGYKQCLIDIQNAIDNHLLAMEKEQMFDYTKSPHIIGEATERYFTEDFEKYYNETYTP